MIRLQFPSRIQEGNTMPFEVFDKRQAGTTKIPFVTIQKTGSFSLNKAAVNLLGNPEGVELLFDPEENLIGFKPAALTNPRAFALRTQGGHSSTQMVSGHRFSKYHELDTTVARRYGVEMVDDILVLDLKSDSVVVSIKSSKDEEA
jgi:hypothetical protein